MDIRVIVLLRNLLYKPLSATAAAKRASGLRRPGVGPSMSGGRSAPGRRSPVDQRPSAWSTGSQGRAG